MPYGMPRIVFHVERNFAINKIAIYIAQKSSDGEHIAYMKTATFQEESSIAVIPDADPLLVDKQDAQYLMDGLWNAGIRPTDGRDKSDIIQAKDNHIHDLIEVTRSLFELLKPKVR
jgi:hypothetical protein